LRKLENKCIVWLTYFDASKTYGEGRKVPKRFALNSPRMEELVKAAEILNLNPQPNPDAKFPRCWWEKSGYVIVDKISSKHKTLLILAQKIAELRGKR